MDRNSMVQRVMGMLDVMLKKRQALKEEKLRERTKKEEREAEKRTANMKLKKKRSYALKGAAEKRRSK